MSERDKHKNLSPEEHLDLIRPYLRDLINDQTPIENDNAINN